MWSWSSMLAPGLPFCVLLTLSGVPITQGQVTQGQDWSARLQKQEYFEAGRSLSRLPDQPSLESLGTAGLALLRLDLPSARLVRRGLSSGGASGSRLVGLLDDLIQFHRGNPLPLVPRLDGLLEDRAWQRGVLPFLGRGALQLCRSGQRKGVEILERILRLYPGADWALSNLANGDRFVGDYEKAIGIYARLMQQHGRQAWFLNGLALVHQARFERDKALALYLEGGKETCPGTQADRFTCRTNAAVLLIARGKASDLDRAEQLLDSVVSKDPAAIRAPYYLRRIQRLRRGCLG